ncbi:MAG TPA: universal stress protein [Mycobacterium sp.]|nr:universal stress protein [Mycobacterium sp.]
MWKISAPVVVGIDGSDAAINAAKWAADEAIRRDVPLRIVHVTHIEDQPSAPQDAFQLDVQYAESSLRAATAAVEATGKPVKIEADVLWGTPDTNLISESRNASMVCVGSSGIGPLSKAIWGSTAASVAEKAYCPVAVIRYPHDVPASESDWIVVVVEDRADNESVIEQAMEEARLRNAPVLAVGVWQDEPGKMPRDELDRRIEKWKKHYPDVRVYPVATADSMAGFLANHEDLSVQLAIVGRADAADVTHMIGPHSHPLVAHGECSVLVMR